MNKTEIQKLKVVSEQFSNEHLDFYQYSSHWVFLGSETVVKVSKTDLKYEIDATSYLSGIDFPALPPINSYVHDGYYFYAYKRGNSDIGREVTIPFLEEYLPILHSLKVPTIPKLVSYEEEVKRNIERWKSGFSLMPQTAIYKIHRLLKKSFDLRIECINHGDPLSDNIVKIDGKLYFIDWEHVCLAPRELDLAIIKYREFFGEPIEAFAKVSRNYGSYDERKLQILIDSRAAYGLIWYAKNVSLGFFKNDGELEKRTARLMGDESIVFTRAV